MWPQTASNCPNNKKSGSQGGERQKKNVKKTEDNERRIEMGNILRRGHHCPGRSVTFNFLKAV